MAERKKLIDRLETALMQMHGSGRYTPEDVDELEMAGWDALALLREQNPPIRCAECRYFRRGGNPDGFGWCDRPGAGCSLPEDYYCKYGTKKEADNG